jgi:hypothetical protein
MSEENKDVEHVPQQEQIKPYWFFLRNSKGFSSVTLTMTWISFLLVSILYVANAFEQIGSVKLRPFDVSSTSVYFGVILASYVGRKFTDRDKT